MGIEIELDDELVQRARARAEARGIALECLIEEAVRAALAAMPPAREDLPVSTAGRLMVDLDWTSNEAILDFLDEQEWKSQT